jgi:phasin family protein
LSTASNPCCSSAWCPRPRPLFCDSARLCCEAPNWSGLAGQGQSVKQFQDFLSAKPSSASVTETLVKQIDLTKTAYEKTVADARELGDIVVKVGSEAGDILSRRVVASLDEVKAAARPKAAVLDEVKATAQPKAAGRVAIVA